MFKRHAHLFTLISTVWTVLTLIAFTFVSGTGERDRKLFLIAIGIWSLHLMFISLSIYFWRTEQESVLWIEVEEQGANRSNAEETKLH